MFGRCCFLALAVVLATVVPFATAQGDERGGPLCPPVQPDEVGICVEQCSSHAACPDNQLCCSNGCGHVCQDPVDRCFLMKCQYGCKNSQCLPAPTEKPHTGTCPSTAGLVGICVNECEGHGDCGDGKLCCSNGCGTSCMEPVRDGDSGEDEADDGENDEDEADDGDSGEDEADDGDSGEDEADDGDSGEDEADDGENDEDEADDGDSDSGSNTGDDDEDIRCLTADDCDPGYSCRKVGDGCPGDVTTDGRTVYGKCLPMFEVYCTQEYKPVCGCDHKTYGNACSASAVGVRYRGQCKQTSAGTTATSAKPTTEGTTAAPEPRIPPHCVQWYDGCNTCSVKGGEVTGCTKRGCVRPTKPRCTEFKIPETCVSWYDGCNICSVRNGRAFLCTQRACVEGEREQPYCRQYASSTTAGGTTDDSATTGRSTGRTTATAGSTTTAPAPSTTAGATGGTPSTPGPRIPPRCEKWFDGCNECIVEHGQILGCTEVACKTYKEPRCLKFSRSDIPHDCLSWFDGCNTCSVVAGRLMDCTERACLEDAMTEPKCVQRIPETCKVFFDGCNTCHFLDDGRVACTKKYCARDDIREPKCLEHRCSDVFCTLFCENGFKKNEHGCDICECREPCGDVLCELFCEHGFQTDENGCDICECAEAPCPQVRCSDSCELGYLKDERGCDTCNCIPSPTTATTTGTTPAFTPLTTTASDKVVILSTTSSTPTQTPSVTTTTATTSCEGDTCPPPPPCPAPPEGCRYEPDRRCGCIVGCGQLICRKRGEGERCNPDVDTPCKSGLACLQGTCQRDPCLEADCEQNKVCVPRSIQCFATPCPQYTCEPKEHCHQDPCGPEQTCVPVRRMCVTTPCEQFMCVNPDVCDPSPCAEGQRCVEAPENCADCPPYQCVDESGPNPTPTGSTTTTTTTTSTTTTTTTTKTSTTTTTTTTKTSTTTTTTTTTTKTSTTTTTTTTTTTATTTTKPRTVAPSTTASSVAPTIVVEPEVLVVGRMSVTVQGNELDLELLREEFLHHLRATANADIMDVTLEIVGRARDTEFEIRYVVHLAHVEQAAAVEEQINAGSVFVSLSTSSTSFAASGIGETSREKPASSSSDDNSSATATLYIGVAVGAVAAVLIVVVAVALYVRKANNSAAVRVASNRELHENPIYFNPNFMRTSDGECEA